MAYSLAQKKKAMRELIDTYYAEPLQKAGFVSYKGENFHWYRIKGELLQTVRMPILSPSQPIVLDLGFGAVPLFTWEPIAPTGPARDFDWDFHHGSDHFTSATKLATLALAEKKIGKLPRSSYASPVIFRHLDSGLLIGHLNSERCGGETVDELILPLLDTMLTVKDIYQWNKMIRAVPWSCSSDVELIQMLEREYLNRYRGINFLSLAFADECLYCRDEGFYPILLYYLKENRAMRTESPVRPKTMAQSSEWAKDIAHETVLIEVLETKNMDLFATEVEKQKSRMSAQIQKKLPELCLPKVHR